MTLIQRGDTSEGLRRRWQIVNADSAPAELGDAIQPVQIVEGDRAENLALSNVRLCAWEGAHGDHGAGAPNFCSLFNPANSGVLAVVTDIVFTNIVVTATIEPTLNLVVDGSTGGVLVTSPTPHFQDTRIQGLPACEVRTDSVPGTGVAFFVGRLRPQVSVGTHWKFRWPHQLVLAPNTRAMCFGSSPDSEAAFSFTNFVWYERPMGSLEAFLNKGEAGTTGGRWTL